MHSSICETYFKEVGGVVTLPWVYVHSAIYENIWCSGVALIYRQLEEGSGVSLPWVYVHTAIYENIWCSGVA